MKDKQCRGGAQVTAQKRHDNKQEVVATLRTNLPGGLAKVGKYESTKERFIHHKASRCRGTALRSTPEISKQVGAVALIYEKWHTTAMTGRGQMLHETCCQVVSGRPLIYSQSGKRVGVIIHWLGG